MTTEQKIHSHVASSFAVEALACLEATRIRVTRGFQRVCILGDARSIIIKSKSKNREKSEISAIIQRIHEEKKQFQDVEFIYIPRQFNTHAHNIATVCLRENQNTYLDRNGEEVNHDDRL